MSGLAGLSNQARERTRGSASPAGALWVQPALHPATA
jgi:hypothetical protein